jgi:hypothetical protein
VSPASLAGSVANLLWVDETRAPHRYNLVEGFQRLSHREDSRRSARSQLKPDRFVIMFVALLPVRDEADIVGQCLQYALQWADAIDVFDTASVDDTGEIVQDLAARDKRVILMRKEPVYLSLDQVFFAVAILLRVGAIGSHTRLQHTGS